MSRIDGALRAHAAGSLSAVAAAELLIAGAWPGRDDFADFVTVTASPGGGLVCSGGERRMLALTASLAAGIPAGLRDAVTGLDGRNARLIAGAVLHASGHRDTP